MTYPQQPAGPAYGYQPQPGFPQQYAQPPTQTYTQQPQPAPAMPAPIAFRDPSGGVAFEVTPRVRDLTGRTIAYVPKSKGEEDNLDQAKNPGKHPTLTADLYVLDGGPLQYGGSQERGNEAPHCYEIDTPCKIEKVYLREKVFVDEGIKVLDVGLGEAIPCRPLFGKSAYLPVRLGRTAENAGDLADPRAHEADALKVALHQFMTDLAFQRYVNPVPREINGGPRQKPNQANAQAAPAAQVATYPPQPTAQVVYPQATAQHPIAQAYNAQAPAQQQYAPQPAAPFIAAGTMPPQAQFAPGSREAYLSGQEAPMGWNLDVWRQQVEAGRAAQFLPQQ